MYVFDVHCPLCASFSHFIILVYAVTSIMISVSGSTSVVRQAVFSEVHAVEEGALQSIILIPYSACFCQLYRKR